MQALESHTFEPVRMLQWRNSTLDFSSIGALQASLAATPNEPGLTRAPIAEDILVLEHAARDEDVRAMASGPAAVERLWDVCQVPDYRKIAPATHAELVVTLYGFLMREGNIPTDWFASRWRRPTVSTATSTPSPTGSRMSGPGLIVANRPDWLADPEHWQDVTRAVEDKLSDALHERLAERFVDRRTSVLMRRLRENAMLETEIGKTGEVTVEGHVIGRLDGFMFAPDASAAGSEAQGAQRRRAEGARRRDRARAPPSCRRPPTTRSCWRMTARCAGPATWSASSSPATTCCARACASSPTSSLTGPARELVQTRLDLWLKTHIEKLLGAAVLAHRRR